MFEMRAKMISVGLLGAAVVLPVDLAQADQLGHASWYSLPANITANGEKMDPNELTAAHRSLPFGTRVLVENLSNGRSVVVRINDRGPFIGGRIIDLSKAAAASIGMIDSGTAKVRVTAAAGGSALAALGDAKAKAKNGASQSAVASAEIAEAPSKARAVAYKPSTKKSLAARASLDKKQVARKLASRSKMQVAAAPMRANARKERAYIRALAASDGIHAVAEQASGLPTRRTTLASYEHPYAILGATPGFMKPSRSRRTG